MVYIGYSPVIKELHKIRPAPICDSVDCLPPAFDDDPVMIIARLDDINPNAFKQNAFPVLLSSAEVFPGTWGNYSEDDLPFPVTKHGNLALAYESIIKAYYERFLIIRFPDIMYTGHEIDVKMSFEPFDIIAEKILFLIDNDAEGIYHIGGVKRSLYQISKDAFPDWDHPQLSSDSGMKPMDLSLNTKKYSELHEEKHE